MKYWQFELSIDFSGDAADKVDYITDEVRSACQNLLAHAALLADKRKPRCTLKVGDNFSGIEETEIVLSDNPER